MKKVSKFKGLAAIFAMIMMLTLEVGPLRSRVAI